MFGPRPDLHRTNRRAIARAQVELHNRNSDPQHATSCPYLRLHCLSISGGPYRIRRDQSDFHQSDAPRDRRLYYRALRVRPKEEAMDTTQPQHTNRQYEEDLRGLRAGLLKMGGLVERQIAEAMEALVDRDSPHARE